MPLDTKLTSTCLAKAAEDEPIFVLRGRDRLTPYIVRQWAEGARLAGTPMEKVKDAQQLADDIERWQVEHGSKIPD